MKSLGKPAFLLACAACVLLALTIACHKTPADMHAALREIGSSNGVAPQSGGPVLLAAYQPWFGGRNHINVGYSSQDPGVLHRQIAQAHDMGIEGFAVNWYGPRKEYEDKAYA